MKETLNFTWTIWLSEVGHQENRTSRIALPELNRGFFDEK